MSHLYHAYVIQTDDPTSPRVTGKLAASKLNNRAIAAQSRGRFEEAVELHKQALELKLTVYDPEAIEVAISYEGLGIALRLAKRVAEARQYHEKALYIRDDVEFGGLGKGIREDAAYTRESLACVLEFEGKMDEAKALRLKGEAKNQLVCAWYYQCTKQGCLPLSELKACAGCHSVFYHSTYCQKEDWKMRHKGPCKAYSEEVKSKAADQAGESKSASA